MTVSKDLGVPTGRARACFVILAGWPVVGCERREEPRLGITSAGTEIELMV